MPRIIGTLIGAKLATLEQLQTVYSAQDAYDLLEIHAVDSHNEQEARKRAALTPTPG